VKELRSIFGLLVLLVGGFVLYRALPAYWGNFQVNRMITEQAVVYTNFPKSDDEIANAISQKAQEYSVPLAPEQVTVFRTSSDLTISITYTVHVDIPVYPFDLTFNDSTSNHNVMK
jgi:hypothetical protein